MDTANGKILLISDMPSKAIAFNQILKNLGYESIVAFSISRALALLRSIEFKVIVIEQSNPDSKKNNDYQHLLEYSNKASIKICIISKTTTENNLPEINNGLIINSDNHKTIAAELDRILG